MDELLLSLLIVLGLFSGVMLVFGVRLTPASERLTHITRSTAKAITQREQEYREWFDQALQNDSETR